MKNIFEFKPALSSEDKKQPIQTPFRKKLAKIALRAQNGRKSLWFSGKICAN
jgi:hypothetical protein